MTLATPLLLAGRYEVRQPLGSGGMGTVYHGWDHVDRLPCAIKHISRVDASTLAQLKVEAELLLTVRSAHIPRLYAHLEQLPVAGQALVMEYIEGEDLETRVRSGGPLDEQQALEWILQLVEALFHLHTQQPAIIHRDIKPANIRIDRYGNAWLLDLGIGKRGSLPTGKGAQLGTPGYAPFEQYSPQLLTDQRSDIYAVGATLYYLLSGEEPLAAPLRQIGNQLPALLSLRPQLNPRVERLVQKAMAVEPAQRFPNANELHDALSALLDPSFSLERRRSNHLRQALSVNMSQAIVAEHTLPPQQPMLDIPDPPLPPGLRRALGERELYRHQVESLAWARKGRDIVVATGTASGKSMCYNLPVLERCLNDERAHALYLFPIKALINDQAHNLRQLVAKLGAGPLAVDVLHGDIGPTERQAAQHNPPRIALSNPEFVHWMLAAHPRWRRLFARLQYIVLDEVHTYRGVFGSNVAQLMRRLLRICQFYGAAPQIISCSATIGNPAELVEKLTGRKPRVIDRDGSAKVRRNIVFWQPINLGEGARRGSTDDAALITVRAVAERQQVITFARARQEVELMLVAARRAARESNQPPRHFEGYRGGYTRADREQIEQRLRKGEARAVFSTNALELGIDIGSLQMAVLTGFPGSRMSFWQQAGRAGRRGEDAHIILVASANPLDGYYMAAPHRLLFGGAEEAIVDLDNPYIGELHLCCMARERPIQEAELVALPAETRVAFDRLVAQGTLTQQPGSGGAAEYVYTGADLPHKRVSLRSATRESYTILCVGRPEPLGTIEPPQLYREAQEEAIYFYRGEPFRVLKLDARRRQVHVEPYTKPHFTRPIGTIKPADLQAERAIDLQRHGIQARCAFGRLRVEEKVTGSRKYHAHPRKKIGEHALPQPYVYELKTKGLWLWLDEVIQRELDRLTTARMTHWSTRPGDSGRASPSALVAALHGLEHLLVALIPTIALCDPRDIAGYYEDTLGIAPGHPQLCIYDLFPGGIGLAERAAQHLPTLLGRAYDLVGSCECTTGCPSCIEVGWCYEENQNLDKEAVYYLLGRLLGRPTVLPKPPSPGNP